MRFCGLICLWVRTGVRAQQYKHTQFLCNVPGCISRSQYIRVRFTPYSFLS
jgi:hypothetical protein